MDWIVVIPTHNRTDVLQKKTLPLLKRVGVPASKINLFVSGEDQKKAYLSAVPKDLYNELHAKPTHDIGDIKNAITKHYPEGKKIVIVEDDLNNLMKLSADGKKLVELTDLPSVIQEGFALCKQHKTILWGISPSPNAFYMKKAPSFDLKFILGTCYGILNDKSIHLKTAVKEDYELSLIVWKKYHSIVRFNNISARRRAYPDVGKGGLGSLEERKKRTEKAVEYLLKTYGDLIREVKPKQGLREIQMKRGKATGSSGVSDSAEIEGGAKPPLVDITDEDKTDTSVNRVAIRNKSAYNQAKEELLEALKSISVHHIPKPDTRGTTTNRGNVIGKIGDGRTMTFGFGDNRHGWNFYSTNKKHPEVYKALVKFGNLVVPKGWEYQGITLNHNVKAKKHIDKKNVGRSVIVGFGDYQGGEIRVWDEKGGHHKDFDLKDNPLMFNGGVLAHETQPFTNPSKYEKGKGRYTIIFYKQNRRPAHGKVGVGAGSKTSAKGLTPAYPVEGGAIFA
jgi:hypothetical protein